MGSHLLHSMQSIKKSDLFFQTGFTTSLYLYTDYKIIYVVDFTYSQGKKLYYKGKLFYIIFNLDLKQQNRHVLLFSIKAFVNTFYIFKIKILKIKKMGPDTAAPITVQQITEFQKAFAVSHIMHLLVQWITLLIFCHMQSPNSYWSNVPWSGNSSTCIIHVFTAPFHLVWAAWYVPSFSITLSHSPSVSKIFPSNDTLLLHSTQKISN